MKHELIHRYLRLNRKDMALFQFIIEGYEGLATVSTVDRRRAEVVISIMPDFAQDVEDILSALRVDIAFEEIPPSKGSHTYYGGAIVR